MPPILVVVYSEWIKKLFAERMKIKLPNEVCIILCVVVISSSLVVESVLYCLDEVFGIERIIFLI